jgi:hypothetical protein
VNALITPFTITKKPWSRGPRRCQARGRIPRSLALATNEVDQIVEEFDERRSDREAERILHRSECLFQLAKRSFEEVCSLRLREQRRANALTFLEERFEARRTSRERVNEFASHLFAEELNRDLGLVDILPEICEAGRDALQLLIDGQLCEAIGKIVTPTLRNASSSGVVAARARSSAFCALSAASDALLKRRCVSSSCSPSFCWAAVYSRLQRVYRRSTLTGASVVPRAAA